MSPLEVALAFMAGALTLLSPCSFPLLPGYISYYLGSKSLPKAALGGLVCASSVIAVFSAVGAVASALGGLASKHVPLLQVGASAVIALMGFVMAFEGRAPSFSVRLGAPRRRGLAGLLLYGVVYGLAAAGCSAPIFLSVVLYAFSFGGALHGALVFVAYAMGIGLPIVLVSVLAAKIKEAVLARAVGAAPLMRAVGGYSLIAIGLYLLYQSLVSALAGALG
ncbi:MAG: cytochrome c biogenesis protein CcdA [Candidatus Nezhaarchaeales archaeon]